MINAFNRLEAMNNTEATMRQMLTGWQSQMWTALPAIVTGVNFTEMTITARPAITAIKNNQDGSTSQILIPQLIHCPILFQQAGGFALTLPIVIGSEVLILFSSRCIDAWWQNGAPIVNGDATPAPAPEFRMHDISDGFALPGPCSVPNVFPNISTTDAQLRNKSGTTFVSIGANGKIGFQNTDTSLKQTLTDLQSALNTFMTVLAGFSGGGAGVTQSMLQVPAAACETALSTVLTEIGELLQ